MAAEVPTNKYLRHLKRRWREDGHGDVMVYADAWVSINGRRRARLIDPAVDLADEEEGFAAKPWILNAPETALGPHRLAPDSH
ncbi:MAG: vitamin K-dependent gamma-carboxylase [Polyangiales bacterium]|jgi:vitamin K-dependent gamma-carboxylase